MTRILFKNAHLVIDGYKEYLDGAMLVNDETIEDVFMNTNHLKKDLGEYKEIDLKGNIVMPGFFDIHNEYIEDEKLAIKGTTSYLRTINDIKVNKYSRDLGLHICKPSVYDVDELLDSFDNIKQITIDPKLNNDDVIEKLRKRNIKVMFMGNATNKDIYKYHDGYACLFVETGSLLIDDMSLTNLAFEDNCYVQVITKGINESMLKLILHNIRKDRIMLVSDSKKDDSFYLSDEITLIRKLGTSLTDILLMTSLNAYRFLGLDKRFGSLIKGKYSDFVILDKELNIVGVYVKGKMKYVEVLS